MLLCVGWMADAQPSTGQTTGVGPGSDDHFGRCREIRDAATRLRCYEDAGPTGSQKLDPNGLGNWRLVRTPDPGGGQDAVSIMRTADVTRSDLDFAGLMVRCREGNAEVLVVLVRPIPPRAHPTVVIGVAGKKAEFIGTVVPPGEAVLLPTDASAMAAGSWQTATELTAEVEDQQGPIHGTVSLSGLGAAFRTLLANCPSH